MATTPDESGTVSGSTALFALIGVVAAGILIALVLWFLNRDLHGDEDYEDEEDGE